MDNNLVEKYGNLIYSIAKKFDGYKSKEDLYQAGFMGLIMAVKNYKVEFDSKFSTYAYKYIYGEMSKLVREDKLIKISRSVLKLKNRIEVSYNILEQKLNRKPTILELSSFLEMKPTDIEEVLKINNKVFSMDEEINGDNTLSLHEVIKDKNIDILTLVALKDAMTKLDKKSIDILLYSMNMTEREIASIYNTNQVNVSRTLKKIKKNIRQNMQ